MSGSVALRDAIAMPIKMWALESLFSKQVRISCPPILWKGLPFLSLDDVRSTSPPSGVPYILSERVGAKAGGICSGGCSWRTYPPKWSMKLQQWET
eukprot:1727400-Amphidinium_carterae.1